MERRPELTIALACTGVGFSTPSLGSFPSICSGTPTCFQLRLSSASAAWP